MAEIVRMPKMSDTMTEGVIAKWHKKVGDTVKSGELMAEVETDKATMDYESFNDGVVLHLGAKEGEAVAVNGVLAVVGKKGEDYKSLLSESAGAAESSSDGKSTEAKSSATAVAEKVDVSNIKAELVLMPKMSDTMTDGVIAAWHKKVGDNVKSGELMAEVETDKATMEYESYHDGTVLYIGAKEKESIPVNGVLAIVGEKDADWKTLLKSAQEPQQKEESKPEQTAPAAAPVASAPASSSASSNGSNGRVKASPLAKKMAKDMGIDIAKIEGSGDHGRITKKDIENYTPGASPAKAAASPVVLPSVVGEESFEDVTVSQMRKTIARRLSESMYTAPHFYLTMEINMDKAIEARKSINEIAPVKISFNDIVLKAVAAALRQHPDVNVSWLGDKIRKNKHIHVGVAVAVKDGLMVPVIRFADNKSLAHIAMEVKDLAQKAHDKKLQPSDWEGSTFTISNLGMFGIDEFTAIINPPDACILAVGGIRETAIVKNGQLVPGNLMKVTLSCDHRAVDGAVGSAFLKTLKGLLEDPVRILI